MKDHPVSQMYMREVLPSWNDKGYKVKIYDAVTSRDLIYKNKIDFDKKYPSAHPDGIDFSSTEKAVWYSHFELWCKCFIQGPMIIIEHDSFLTKPLPDQSKFSELDYQFISFMTREWRNQTVFAPGSGYYITRQSAALLIAAAVSRTIKQNSDGHLIATLFGKKPIPVYDPSNPFFCVEQISIDGLNTIDHGPRSRKYRKFIGLDYENFDIPSVHGKAI